MGAFQLFVSWLAAGDGGAGCGQARTLLFCTIADTQVGSWSLSSPQPNAFGILYKLGPLEDSGPCRAPVR